MVNANVKRASRSVATPLQDVGAARSIVAGDLRQIIAAIAIASELERIADRATNIAERVVSMVRGDGVALNL